MARINLKTKIAVKVKQKQTLKYVGYSAFGIIVLSVILIIYFNTGQTIDSKAIEQNSITNGYSWKKTIEINNSNCNSIITDYIFTISEINDDFKNVLAGGKFKKIDASDIIFINSMNNQTVRHKILKYDSNTGELIVKLKLDTLYNITNNKIFMYFGNDNPIAINDSIYNQNYSGVWEFESNEKDFSLNQNNATNKGNPAFCNSVVGQGLCLDGSKRYFNVKDDNSLDLTNQGTIAAWIKINNYTNFAGIVHKGDKKNFTDEAYSLQLWNNNKIMLSIFDNSTALQLFSTNVATNTWYWLVATWDATGMKIYLNGELNNSSNQTLVARNTNGGVNIGAQIEQNYNNAYQNFPFDGNIDQVMILKSVFTPEYIKSYYNNIANKGNFYTLGLTESVTNTLPVEMGNFTAKLEGENVKLSWLTYSEINNSYFSIERSSDGIIFEQLDVVVGSGNTRNITNYTYIDENPLEGDNYYKLKQTDYDGKNANCGVAAVKFEATMQEFEINRIYPNPITSNSFKLDLNSNINGIVKLVMVNSSGSIIFQKSLEVSSGNNIINVDLNNNLSQGNYFISVTDDIKNSNTYHVVKL